MALGESSVTIGAISEDELEQLLALYQHLHPDDPVLAVDEPIRRLWHSILLNRGFHYVVARCRDQIISTCSLTIIPNLTRMARPYGVIENVVTHPDHRRRGIGTSVLRYALRIAWAQNCYKVMLLTGGKQEGTLRFYERVGFARGEKTGLIARPPAT